MKKEIPVILEKKTTKKENTHYKNKENELKILKCEKEINEKAKEVLFYFKKFTYFLNILIKKIETNKEKQDLQENYQIKQMKIEKESLVKTLINLKKMMKIKDED